MGDPNPPRGPRPARPLDPAVTGIPRRRVLVLLGTTAGVLALGSGLGGLLAACAGPPVTVVLDVDPDTLEPGTPAEIAFTVTLGGATVDASVWLVRKASGEVVGFDPRCTHGLCGYRWSGSQHRFLCGCHEGQFALDGSVLAGPPARPLDQLPVRVVGGTVEVDVPGSFETPRESLPA
jgi:Rieske Fe-S protein